MTRHDGSRALQHVQSQDKENTGVLAQRFCISTETIRKWRKRGPDDCLDHSVRPHTLPWKATDGLAHCACRGS